jgi:hypothetical protein
LLAAQLEQEEIDEIIENQMIKEQHSKDHMELMHRLRQRKRDLQEKSMQ